MYGQQDYNEAFLLKIFYENFMDQVQVIQNLYAKYDAHTLSLLDDASYRERVLHLNEVSKAYVSVILEILETESLIERIKERIAKAEKAGKNSVAEKWRNANEWNDIFLQKQYALKGRAESKYAMFRNIALVNAFKQAKKRGQVSGLGEKTIDSIKQKIAMARKKAEKAKDSEKFTKEENESIKKAGMDPEEVAKGMSRSGEQ